jgi:hypothetical protein
MLMLDKVRVLAEEFDILHFHIDQHHFPLSREMAGRTVTTLHGRQELPDLKSLYIGFSEMPLVSISNDRGGRSPRPTSHDRTSRNSDELARARIRPGRR